MTTIHETDVFVRFCETDAAGNVNNTSHFLYFEEARTKFLNEVFPERNSLYSFILVSITCNYLAQAYAGGILRVQSKVIHIGNKSFTMEHKLINLESNTTIATGKAVVVCYNYEQQKAITLCGKWKERLHKCMG